MSYDLQEPSATYKNLNDSLQYREHNNDIKQSKTNFKKGQLQFLPKKIEHQNLKVQKWQPEDSLLKL